MLAAWEYLSDRIISSIILCSFRGAEVLLLKLVEFGPLNVIVACKKLCGRDSWEKVKLTFPFPSKAGKPGKLEIYWVSS